MLNSFLQTNYRFDVDALNYLNAVESTDGEPLEFYTKKAINEFVLGCKEDLIWDSIGDSCIIAGARTLLGALVPLKGAVPGRAGFTSSDYSRSLGLNGKENAWLNSNSLNNKYPQNDHHMGVYLTQTRNDNVTKIFMSSGGTSDIGRNILNANTTSNGLSGGSRNNSGTTTTSTNNQGYTLGYKGVNRASSTLISLRSGGTTNNYSSTSQTPNNANILLYRHAMSVAATPLFATGMTISFYSIGNSLNMTLLDNRITKLMNDFSIL